MLELTNRLSENAKCISGRRRPRKQGPSLPSLSSAASDLRRCPSPSGDSGWCGISWLALLVQRDSPSSRRVWESPAGR
jgi:hypothetical protein